MLNGLSSSSNVQEYRPKEDFSLLVNLLVLMYSLLLQYYQRLSADMLASCLLGEMETVEPDQQQLGGRRVRGVGGNTVTGELSPPDAILIHNFTIILTHIL